jgi:sn-glycerol 3-phosphate transport system ATP-binding protein/multiple sugar transport system ATP-binding protein
VSRLALQGVHKKLGDQAILKGIDLSAATGELVVLVGPSGCGKSTLLRCVAGLEEIDAGTIHIGDTDVTRLAPKDRDIGMVFQSYALYPHLTVRENLAFGLTLRREKAALIEERVSEASKMLGLEQLLDRLPKNLSGGQRQRVAMGRAIARRPKLFLFDEPLSNLDAALRAEVRVEIKRLHERLKATMLYVTHDQVEAMTLADRLVVLNGGKVEQQGPPLEVYQTPRTRFVAGFLGSPAMNFLEVKIEDGRARASGVDYPIEASGALTLGVRAHDVRPSAGEGHLRLMVDVIEAMGFESYAHGRVGETPFVARLEGNHPFERGAVLPLDITAAHAFDPKSGEALR